VHARHGDGRYSQRIALLDAAAALDAAGMPHTALSRRIQSAALAIQDGASPYEAFGPAIQHGREDYGRLREAHDPRAAAMYWSLRLAMLQLADCLRHGHQNDLDARDYILAEIDQIPLPNNPPSSQ
jgi:hypothetical protein